jgi:hypothetical protein
MKSIAARELTTIAEIRPDESPSPAMVARDGAGLSAILSMRVGCWRPPLHFSVELPAAS